MYAVCTFQLAKALDLKFLFLIPRVFVYFALLAWVATFIGLVRAGVGAMFDSQLRAREQILR
jgi:hypothetical protein